MVYKAINPHNILAMEEFGQPEPTDETPIYILVLTRLSRLTL